MLGQLVEPTYGTVATMATVTIVGDSGHGDHNVHGCDLMARVAIAGDSDRNGSSASTAHRGSTSGAGDVLNGSEASSKRSVKKPFGITGVAESA